VFKFHVRLVLMSVIEEKGFPSEEGNNERLRKVQ
jgi:hypothetical protein